MQVLDQIRHHHHASSPPRFSPTCSSTPPSVAPPCLAVIDTATSEVRKPRVPPLLQPGNDNATGNQKAYTQLTQLKRFQLNATQHTLTVTPLRPLLPAPLSPTSTPLHHICATKNLGQKLLPKPPPPSPEPRPNTTPRPSSPASPASV